MEGAQQLFTEEGKQLLAEKGDKGFAKWHTDVVQKMQHTTEMAAKNLEDVSKSLLEALPLPKVESDAGVVFDGYIKMRKSLEITNTAGNTYKETALYPVIQSVEKLPPLLFGDAVLSTYLVGSTTRGDEVLGVSDLNFVMVVRDDSLAIIPLKKRVVSRFQVRNGVTIDLTVVNEAQFRDPASRKLRFICATRWRAYSRSRPRCWPERDRSPERAARSPRREQSGAVGDQQRRQL